MAKKLIYLLALTMLWIPIASTQEDECHFLPSTSPVWDSVHGIIAVSGCKGIQFYDEALNPISLIEISGLRSLALSSNSKWLAAASRKQEQTAFIDLETLQIVFTIESGNSIRVWHPNESWLALFDHEDRLLLVIDADSQDILYEQAYEQVIDHLPLHLWWQDDNSLNYVGHSGLYHWILGDLPELVQDSPVSIQWGMFSGDVWSPDGTKAVFMFRGISSDGGQFGIWNITDGTYKSIVIEDVLFRPIFSIYTGISWHPSGEYIALSTYEGLFIVDAITQDIVGIYSILEIEPSYEIQLDGCDGRAPIDVSDFIAWSPDGTQILITSRCRLAIFRVEELQDGD